MVAPQSQFESKYQALHSFGATFWRASTGWTGGTFVSYDVGDLGLPTLISSINERIDVKNSKRYSQQPLWLILTVSESWRDSIGSFFDGIQDGSIIIDTRNFETVIIVVTGRALAIPPIATV
jgi:hypothetical protein